MGAAVFHYKLKLSESEYQNLHEQCQVSQINNPVA
jgi:hypothetical protein